VGGLEVRSIRADVHETVEEDGTSEGHVALYLGCDDITLSNEVATERIGRTIAPYDLCRI
jgi:hypothetical protein